ncbi:MAG: hypothetical protein ABSG63_16125 [Spirochaetia bacterium]|jgi:hypothetical protein
MDSEFQSPEYDWEAPKDFTEAYLGKLPKHKRSQAESLLRIFAKALNLPTAEAIHWRTLTYGEVVASRNKAIQFGKSRDTINAMLETIIGVMKVSAKYGLVSLDRITKLKTISMAIEVRNAFGVQKPRQLPELSTQIFFA